MHLDRPDCLRNWPPGLHSGGDPTRKDSDLFKEDWGTGEEEGSSLAEVGLAKGMQEDSVKLRIKV